MTSVPFPLIPGQPEVAFRFTVKATRALEKASGLGIGMLQIRGQHVETMVLLTCYGLRHAMPKLTEDEAADLIEAYIDAGGDTGLLTKALTEALNASGVYGKPERADAEPGDANPPKTLTPPTTH